MTSALKLSEQSLMLNKLEITKSKKTESRSIVEIEIKIKMDYFKATGKALQGPNPSSDPGAHLLHVNSPLWRQVAMDLTPTRSLTSCENMDHLFPSTEPLFPPCSLESPPERSDRDSVPFTLRNPCH